MIVNLWDWRANYIVASNKVSVKVKSVSFAENGYSFVTVGNRHVKFWYLEYNDMANKNKYESLPLLGRNAILGAQRNNYFCDVACGRGDSKDSTYAITKSGLLCEFNNRRLLNKWVELKTESANCVTISQNYILVGCAQGLIRCFRPQTLEFVCTLPRPHSLGIDIAKGFTTRTEMNSLAKNTLNTKPKYADTVAVVYDEYNKIVTAVYSDRSIYFWSLNDIKRIGKLNSFLYHSSCIWDIDIYPFNLKNQQNLLPPGTFLTCSSDDTIRIWNTELELNSNKTAQSYIYKKNFFSPELMKILYLDPELTYLCDPDIVHAKNNNGGNGALNSDQYDSKNGIRAIKFSVDGKHLASGDRCGNIRVFDLEMQKDMIKIEAHDSEVLCLEYSNEETCGRALLVSASRDRFIHIYDVHRQYSCIQNIDDHSSSITSVKFVCNKNNPNNLQLISCGADKSLIFRKQTDPDSDFRLDHHVAGKSTFFDMAVDQKTNQIITASQDRFIRAYDAKTGKNYNSFKGSLGEDGALIKIVFDPSATFVATSCTDKSIYIYDYQTGECLATTSGHSEIVTGLKFSLDGRHLISISGDGCIFVWRLPIEMTNAIASKLGLPLISDSCHTTTIINRNLSLPVQTDSNRNNAYPINVSTLPSWARKQVYDENKDFNKKLTDIKKNEKEFSNTLPRGRWAQRVIEEGHDINSGLVKTYASNFESLASRSTPSTPSSVNSPSMKDSIKNSNYRNSLIIMKEPRTKSSMSSGVEDDDEDRNTTDSDNTCSHDSSYKVNKVNDNNRSTKHMDNYSMVTSISMANINDLPYDDDDSSEGGKTSKEDSKNRYNSLYMSTENLERIDQRNRYLKNVFENIDKTNIENNNSASDDSGINQIDHSLSSNTTSSTLVNNTTLTPQPIARQSLSSKFHNKMVNGSSTLPKDYHETTSDDATLSDITDINQDQMSDLTTINNSGNESTSKFSTLDTIKECKQDHINASNNGDSTNTDKSTMDSAAVTSNPPSTTGDNVTSNINENDYSKSMDLEPKQQPTQPQSSISKKREEMAKTLYEARKRLESVGSTSAKLTVSKSVANLRSIGLFNGATDNVQRTNNRSNEPNLIGNNQQKKSGLPDDDDDNYHSLSIDALRKSISLSDLSRSSYTLPRKLAVYRANKNNSPSMNNHQFAPLWDQRQRVGPTGTPTSGTLSRTPSTNTLNKVDMMRSQSTLCRQGLWNGQMNQSPVGQQTLPPVSHAVNSPAGHLKPPIHANGSMVAAAVAGIQGSPGMMINPRSGRSSAPPSQFRKSVATTSCASSSRRGDSTEDDEELDGSAINSDDDHSDEHRTIRPRPVTPPKPNILKQIRRGSTSNNANQHTPPSLVGYSFDYLNHPHAQNAHPPITQSARPRRLWSTDTMRSSKSEFNLVNIGRDNTPIRRRNNSGVSAGGNIWLTNPPSMMMNDRIDHLSMTNPSSIPLSLDLCQRLVNEMNFVTNYASRIFERASYSDNVPIVDYLRETLGQVSRDLQGIVGRKHRQPHNQPSDNNTNHFAKETNGNGSYDNNNNNNNGTLDKSNNNNSNSNNNNNNNAMFDENDPRAKEMYRQFMNFLRATNYPLGQSTSSNDKQASPAATTNGTESVTNSNKMNNNNNNNNGNLSTNGHQSS